MTQIHTPAEIVIARFGGVRALARLVEKDPSTVHRWRLPVERGGTAGRVPSYLQEKVLDLATKHSVALTADDLIRGSTVLV